MKLNPDCLRDIIITAEQVIKYNEPMVISEESEYPLLNKYNIDEERAEIVRMVFHDYANGMGYREIANKLNNMGVQTKRGNAWDNRGVEYVLNNPVYIGKIRWSKNGPTVSRRIFNSSDTMIVDSNHEPIIDKELFDTVADIMAANKKKHTKYARAALPTDYLFKGLLRCSNCGSTLVQSAKGYFQCHNYAKGKCNTSHSISFNKIQSAIINQLKTDLKNNTFNINFKITHYDNNDLILKQIEKEKQKLKRVKQAYEAGIDTLEEYRENKLNITAAIENLESKILKASNKNKKINDLKNKITDAIYLLENDFTPLSEKNALLKEFIEKIIYNKHEQTLYLYYFV